MGVSVVNFNKVRKSYGDRKALDDFCLDLQEGEFLTVIGSSGCGKTTMLKMINGLHRPDGGELRVWGEDLAGADLIRLRRRIGYVIQGAGLFPHLNVWDNIAYVPRLAGRRASVKGRELAARIRRLMAMVGLEEGLSRRYPAELSGGQQQRVGIARALAGSPELLLMDEPFSAVDEITREKLQDETRRIYGELGLSVVFVTHDVREACKLGSRVLVMDAGRAVQIGPPADILERPVNDFVHQLVRQAESC